MKLKVHEYKKNNIQRVSKKIILLLLTTLTLSCCTKDDKPIAEIDKLPPATQIGANKAGCLVNGDAFLPKGSSQFGPTLSCFYQLDQGTYHFGLGIVEKGSNENKQIVLSLNPNQLIENNKYQLISKVNNSLFTNLSCFGEFYITSNINSSILFRSKDNSPGELTITKLDTQQRIISGTFWYDAFDVNGEKVEVREGRFDMRYVN